MLRPTCASVSFKKAYAAIFHLSKRTVKARHAECVDAPRSDYVDKQTVLSLSLGIHRILVLAHKRLVKLASPGSQKGSLKNPS